MRSQACSCQGRDYQIVLNLAEPGPCFVRVGDHNFYEDGSGISTTH